MMFPTSHSSEDGFQHLTSLAKFSKSFSACRVVIDGRSKLLSKTSVHVVSKKFYLCVAHVYCWEVYHVSPVVGSFACDMS